MQRERIEPRGLLRFGPFELDPDNFQLLRRGKAVRIEKAPLELLFVLAERPGKLVSQSAAAELVWGKDVHIETGAALYTAIRKIRQALADTSGKPKYIETVPRKGYRFIALGDQIRSKSHAPGEDGRPMLAVLPLENLSGDAQQEYFSDGLTEELITELGRVSPQQLGVIARTSVMRYKRSTRSIREIGKELGAGYLIEGSVRRDRSRVRIAVQLIRVSDQTHMWAASFDKPLREVLRVQEEVARAAAQEIRVRLAPRPAVPEIDPELYDVYLRGRFVQSQLIPPALRKAIEHFEQVLERSSSFAPAWAALAECYVRLPITSDARPSESFPKAREAAETAIRIDPSLADAYAARSGEQFWHAWDWAEAEANALRAQSCNPSCASAYLWRAHVLSNLGSHHQALVEIARAKQLDPFSRIIATLHGQFQYMAGPRYYTQAETLLRYVLQIDPQFWVAHINFSKLWGMQGRYGKAVSAADRAYRFSHGNTEATALAGWATARAGRKADAKARLKELDVLGKKKYVPPLHRALIHVGLGEKRDALDALDQAVAERDVRLTFLRVEPRWDPLRGEHRFQGILKRVNLAST
jgi:TolB-like protein/Flp pilus assembly protein TadD